MLLLLLEVAAVQQHRLQAAVELQAAGARDSSSSTVHGVHARVRQVLLLLLQSCRREKAAMAAVVRKLAAVSGGALLVRLLLCSSEWQAACKQPRHKLSVPEVLQFSSVRL